jgi:hypothetical protein
MDIHHHHLATSPCHRKSGSTISRKPWLCMSAIYRYLCSWLETCNSSNQGRGTFQWIWAISLPRWVQSQGSGRLNWEGLCTPGKRCSDITSVTLELMSRDSGNEAFYHVYVIDIEDTDLNIGNNWEVEWSLTIWIRKQHLTLIPKMLVLHHSDTIVEEMVTLGESVYIHLDTEATLDSHSKDTRVVPQKRWSPWEKVSTSMFKVTEFYLKVLALQLLHWIGGWLINWLMIFRRTFHKHKVQIQMGYRGCMPPLSCKKIFEFDHEILEFGKHLWNWLNSNANHQVPPLLPSPWSTSKLIQSYEW